MNTAEIATKVSLKFHSG